MRLVALADAFFAADFLGNFDFFAGVFFAATFFAAALFGVFLDGTTSALFTINRGFADLGFLDLLTCAGDRPNRYGLGDVGRAVDHRLDDLGNQRLRRSPLSR